MPEDADVGIRPEKRSCEHSARPNSSAAHQCPVRSLAAFEKSEYADDWRELMRLYLVRRTRSFIQENYAETDPSQWPSVPHVPDGTRSYFPDARPEDRPFAIDDNDPTTSTPGSSPTRRRHDQRPDAAALRPGQLRRRNVRTTRRRRPKVARHRRPLPRRQAPMGFCRTNLFKRLESSGQPSCSPSSGTSSATSSSSHAIENGDCRSRSARRTLQCSTAASTDEDARVSSRTRTTATPRTTGEPDAGPPSGETIPSPGRRVYRIVRRSCKPSRFAGCGPTASCASLLRTFEPTSQALLGILDCVCRPWDPEQDAKLAKLLRTASDASPGRKVLIFTQFADTVDYLARSASAAGSSASPAVTGDTDNPTRLAWRFSPGQQREARPGRRQEMSWTSSLRPMCSARGKTSRTARSSSITTCLGRSFG